MALGAGYKARCGIGKETTWGTLVSPTELITFLSESITRSDEFFEQDTLVSKAGRLPADKTNITVSGSIEMDNNYQALDLIFALAFGGGAETPSGSGPYTHTIKLSEDISRSLSIFIEKDVSVWEIAGAKINTLTISGIAGEPIKVSAEIIAKELTRGTSYRATLSGLAIPSKPRVVFPHLKFRIADLTDALTDDDEIDISEFELTINNNLATDQRGSKEGNYILEPFRNGRREITLSITVRRYTKDTFINWKENGTKLQADLTFTSGSYQQKFEFPTLLVKEVNAPIGSAEIIPVEVTLTAYRNDGNTFITETEECVLTIVNDRSSAIWG